MLNRKVLLIAASCLLFSPMGAMADIEISTPPLNETLPWSLTASVGYTQYQYMYENDGQTALERLAIGKELFGFDYFTLGLETGVQNGNTMRLKLSPTSTFETGGVPIESTIKPIIDLLATIKTGAIAETPAFIQLKGGLAYCNWQFDAVRNQSKIGGEVQAGVGMYIHEHANITLSYQGVFGGNPDFRVSLMSNSGSVSNIPTQQGVLLGLSLIA